jgi:hypothetical protein
VDVYAKPGTKLFGDFKNGVIRGGYDHDKDKAMQHIREGVIYELERADVGGWHTDFFLKEFPGIRFNSVHFVYPIALPLSPPVQEDELTWQQFLKELLGEYEGYVDTSVIDEVKQKYIITKKQ